MRMRVYAHRIKTQKVNLATKPRRCHLQQQENNYPKGDVVMNTSSKIILSLAIVIVVLGLVVYQQHTQIEALQTSIQQLQESEHSMQDKLKKMKDQINDLDNELHPDPAVQRFLNTAN